MTATSRVIEVYFRSFFSIFSSFSVGRVPFITLLLIYFVSTQNGVSALATGDLQVRDTADAKVTAFVQTLDLPSWQIQSLTSKLAANRNLASFLSGTAYSSNVSTTLACITAQVTVGNQSVDTPPVNATAADSNWSEACWATPSCIIFPASASDVSKALKIVTFFQVQFAVRSGGHSPNPGWSSISNPGVLIDLRNLNQITVSADKSVVSLGPGRRWGDVFAALDPYGISVIGGRLPTVGVGGLMLGGGYYHFSGQYGLAADNVKNFEIVLADGTVAEANAQNNTDLFWALKGGGPNFGIVTRYDLYSIPVRNVWYQVGIYTSSQVPAILSAFATWQQNGASDIKSTVSMIVGLETTTVGLLYSEPANKPAAFAPFYNITPALLAVPPTNGTVLGLSQISGSTIASTQPQRHDYRGASSKIDAQLYIDVYNFWLEKALAVHNATGANQTFVIQPVSKNLVAQGKAKGGNALGLSDEDHQWWTTTIDWDNAADDDLVRSVSIATTQKWRELGDARGKGMGFTFMNDASRDQDPLGSYGSENLGKLKAVARRYDPKQVFQKLQRDGFLVSKVGS